jgi:hypothetical protein
MHIASITFSPPSIRGLPVEQQQWTQDMQPRWFCRCLEPSLLQSFPPVVQKRDAIFSAPRFASLWGNKDTLTILVAVLSAPDMTRCVTTSRRPLKAAQCSAVHFCGQHRHVLDAPDAQMVTSIHVQNHRAHLCLHRTSVTS